MMNDFSRIRGKDVLGSGCVNDFPTLAFHLNRHQDLLDEVFSINVVGHPPYGTQEIYVEDKKHWLGMDTGSHGDFCVLQQSKDTGALVQMSPYSSNAVDFFVLLLLAYREFFGSLPELVFPEEKKCLGSSGSAISAVKDQICSAFMAPGVYSYLYKQDYYKVDHDGYRRPHPKDSSSAWKGLGFCEDTVMLRYDGGTKITSFVLNKILLPLYAQMYCDVESCLWGYEYTQRIYAMTEYIVAKSNGDYVSGREAWMATEPTQ